MADKIIEARVWQKVDTEANWLANPLPLGSGEQAFVSDKNNFKVNTFPTKKTFAELEYFYKGDIIGNVTLSDDLSLKSDGVYYAQTSGEYGGVVVKEGYYTLLRKKDGVWSLESEVKMPEVSVEGKVEEGNTQAVSGGEVYNLTKDALLSINEDDYIEVPFTLIAGYFNETGFIGSSVNWISAKIENVNSYGKKFFIGNELNNSFSPWGRVAFYNSNTPQSSSLISMITPSSLSLFEVEIPEGCVTIIVILEASTNIGADLPNSVYLDVFKPKLNNKINKYVVNTETIPYDSLIETAQMEEALSNKFLSGNGIPRNNLGSNNDKYLDNNSLRLYTKSNNIWDKGVFLGGESKFNYPIEFTFRPKNIMRQNNGYYYLDNFENLRKEFAQQYIDTLVNYYVDPINGSNSNNGTSRNTAYKTLTHAIAQGARVINLLPCEGFYPRDSQIGSLVDISTNEPLILIGEGNVIFATSNKGNTYTWISNNGCWSTSRSNVSNVFDFSNLDLDGKPTELTQVNTLAECQTTSNTYYTENNTTLYVHPLNNLVPDSKIEIALNSDVSYTPTSNVPFVYMEGITFVSNFSGGSIVIKNNTTTQFNTKCYIYRCKGWKNKYGNIFSIDNIKECWVQDSEAFDAKNDGFNYHTSRLNQGYTPIKVVEINCKASRFGKDFPSEPSSNCSTIHEGGSIIRLNSDFSFGRGGNVADVNDGVLSLNLNIKSNKNYANNGGSFIIQGLNGKMWVYDGEAEQDLTTQYSFNGNIGNIYYKYTYYNALKVGSVSEI